MTVSGLPASSSAEETDPFEGNRDVGAVTLPGAASYDPQSGTYTIRGSGANMWLDDDQFHWAWRRMRGDFILTARVSFVGEGANPHRKLGWSVRTGFEPGAAHVSAVVHGDGLAALQFRRAACGPTEEVRSAMAGPEVVQLERRGNTFIMSAARFGDTFASVEVTGVVLGEDVVVGLFVCSHDETVVEQATFRDVRIVVPARDDAAARPAPLGCLLELLDVESGHRRVVYRSREPFEAPNWTPDGTALIYNSAGRLYRFDLARRTSTPIDTGFATRNNNDHVLSFDGTMLGISHHSADDGNQSIVYTLPATGGTPKRITPLGPSYLHGWSPDGRFLVYAGQRDGEFDIYRIPAEGGEEIRLTTAVGLDDGPEYTPDGAFIYFNSVRSGTMQIWRMSSDGADQEQVTDDEYNNWFPHVSPDGTSIVFLSFPPEVDPSAHPPYKRVYLRRMPVGGGTPRVIAYVYGGQGTINVPSWSPDSTHVAFVSNTTMG